jgi:hypothetical protein
MKDAFEGYRPTLESYIVAHPNETEQEIVNWVKYVQGILIFPSGVVMNVRFPQNYS